MKELLGTSGKEGAGWRAGKVMCVGGAGMWGIIEEPAGKLSRLAKNRLVGQLRARRPLSPMLEGLMRQRRRWTV